MTEKEVVWLLCETILPSYREIEQGWVTSNATSTFSVTYVTSVAREVFSSECGYSSCPRMATSASNLRKFHMCIMATCSCANSGIRAISGMLTGGTCSMAPNRHHIPRLDVLIVWCPFVILISRLNTALSTDRPLFIAYHFSYNEAEVEQTSFCHHY